MRAWTLVALLLLSPALAAARAALSPAIARSVHLQLTAIQPHLGDHAALTQAFNTRLAQAAAAEDAAAAFVIARAVVEPAAAAGLPAEDRARLDAVRAAFESAPEARPGLMTAAAGLQARLTQPGFAGSKSALDSFYGELGFGLPEAAFVEAEAASAEKLERARLAPASKAGLLPDGLLAGDRAKPHSERLDAVRRLGHLPLERSEGSLRWVAYGSEPGDSRDHAVKVAALVVLHEKGLTLPQPRISWAHAAEVERGWERRPPRALALDYDRTTMPSGERLDRRRAALLGSLSRLMPTMILTARAARARDEISGDVGILEMLEGMTKEEKARLLVGTERGARIYAFVDGKPLVLDEAQGWLPNELAVLWKATTALKARVLKDDHNFTAFLPQGADAEQAKESIRTAMTKAGLKAYYTVFRGKNGQDFIMAAKYSKALGISRLRRLATHAGLVSFSSERWRAAAQRLALTLPGRAASRDEDVLALGDDFFKRDGVDRGMTEKSQPISVDRVHPLSTALPWPIQGPEGAYDVLTRVEGIVSRN